MRGRTPCNKAVDELHLARTHGISVYDARYLELAVRERRSLATLDRRLALAAVAAGVVNEIDLP